jgi:hypothetical protein
MARYGHAYADEKAAADSSQGGNTDRVRGPCLVHFLVQFWSKMAAGVSFLSFRDDGPEAQNGLRFCRPIVRTR